MDGDNMDKKKVMSFSLRLIIAVVLSVLLVAGGTFAYWRWVSDTAKNVVFSTVDNIEDYINYDEGMSYFIGDFQPTFSFCQSAHTTLTFSKKELGKDIKFVATIHMDVNAIGDHIKASDSVHWVVTTGDDNIGCNRGLDSPQVIEYGTFNGREAGSSFALTSDVELLLTTSEKKFTVWIWVDSFASDISNLATETINVNVWTQIDMLDNMYSARENAIGDAYAIYSETDNSLRFYRSVEPIMVGTTYNGRVATDVYTDFEDVTNYSDPDEVPWSNRRSSITSVVVEDSVYPLTTNLWFFGMSKCVAYNLIKLNTSVTTDMSSMFIYASNSTSSGSNILGGLDNWDTSNVTDMAAMFSNFGNATNIIIGDLSGWDTSNVISMNSMFDTFAYSATTINLTGLQNWDTSNVTDMSGMFYLYRDAVNNISLNLSGWNVDNVIKFNNFIGDSVTGIIDPIWVNGTAYAVYSADDNSLRFYRDSGTVTAGSSYRGRTATNVYTGFETGSSVPWSSIASSVTTVVFEDEIRPVSTASWFNGFSNILSVDIEKLDTFNVTTMAYMFYNCNSLTDLNLRGFDTSKVISMHYMFYGCNSLTDLDLSRFDTLAVTNMSSMFYGCTSLANLNLNFNTSSVRNMSYMFRNCSSLNLNLSDWNVDNVTNYTNFNLGATGVVAPAKFSS